MEAKRKLELSTKNIKAMEPEAKRYRVWDTLLAGYFMWVLPTGTKSFSISYTTAQGDTKEFLIGKYGKYTAETARAEAIIKTAALLKGVDIQAVKKADAAKSKTDRAASLGVFIAGDYKEHVEAKHKRSAETLRVLNKEFKHLHSRKMSGITQLDMQRYQNKKIAAGLTAATYRRQIRDLTTCLSKAAEWGIIERNPLAGMKLGKDDKQPRVRYLDTAEEKRLRSALQARQDKQRRERQQFNQWRQERKLELLPVVDGIYTDHLMPIVVLAMNTGLRRGELFNLQWADVNLKGRLLTVRGIAKKDSDTTGAKSGNTRYIPLNDEAFSVLVAWRNQTEGEGLVFASPRTGGRLDNISTGWANLVRAAKLVDFRFHDLRHHFASKLVAAGVDLNTVRELLGHASIEMTLRYSHVSDKHKAAAVALLNQK